jgi:cell division protein FtsI (penicillin-binding protein 3)
MTKPTSIDLYGEKTPVIHKPSDKNWNISNIAWMSFGYNLQVSPLQTCMLYNAVANNGKLMKPFIVKAFAEDGVIISEKQPIVLQNKICNDTTLYQLKKCLDGVCNSEWGTAHKVFKNNPYKVSGKTGTSLVANGSSGYDDKIYQSSFAGYFPSNNPQYTIVVVIKNKPMAAKFYGADVAAPVFKEIADYIYTAYLNKQQSDTIMQQPIAKSIHFWGNKKDAKQILSSVNKAFGDSSNDYDEWIQIKNNTKTTLTSTHKLSMRKMPLLKGLNIKDALQLCEERGLKVKILGQGKIVHQSILPDAAIKKGQIIELTLANS